MKRVQRDLRYDGATAEQVATMLGTKEFREAVCDYQQVLHRTVTVEEDPGARRVVIDQGHGTDRLPGFAKKIVGEHINIVQSETWTDGGTNGQITVTVPGKPGEMTGSATLVEDGAGVTEKVDMTVTVRLPLIGGKAESLIASMLTKALEAEHTVGRRWLAERA